MNRESISEWVQILATIGVIAGLALVAFELRQNTTLAGADMNSQMLAHQQAIYASLRDEEFAVVFSKSMASPENLSKHEQIMMDGYYKDLLSTLIRERQMIRRGVFEDDSMLMARIIVSNGLGTAYGRVWWARNRAGYSDGMNSLIDEALEQAKSGEFHVAY